MLAGKYLGFLVILLALASSGGGCGDDTAANGGADAGGHDESDGQGHPAGDGDGDADPGTEEAGIVGSDGGSVGDTSGASVTIPAGALTEDLELTVATVTVDGATMPEGVTLAGIPVAFTPHGTSFADPVTITLAFSGDPANPVVLRLDDDEDTTWEAVQGGSFEGGVASLEVTSFSIYVVGDSPDDGTVADVDLDADCKMLCEERAKLDCPNDLAVADCTNECVTEAASASDVCYEEYTAFGICAATNVSTEWGCDDGGESTFTGAGGACASEFETFMGCSGF